MTRKIFVLTYSPVIKENAGLALEETEMRKCVPPDNFGWKKNATFRRFKGVLTTGKDIEVIIWEGTEMSEGRGGKKP